MKKCPACGSSRYKEGSCKKCGFLNDPNYLKKKNETKKKLEKDE
ncbi:MAG: hypothetical protein ACTSQY_09675 [Candidatus Odinarchaeia archaeon]